VRLVNFCRKLAFYLCYILVIEQFLNQRIYFQHVSSNMIFFIIILNLTCFEILIVLVLELEPEYLAKRVTYEEVMSPDTLFILSSLINRLVRSRIVFSLVPRSNFSDDSVL
jgi:hypothetical protein